MTNQNKVSSQFIHDTIPQSIDSDCARCQMLEVENQRLKRLVVNMEKNENDGHAFCDDDCRDDFEKRNKGV